MKRKMIRMKIDTSKPLIEEHTHSLPDAASL